MILFVYFFLLFCPDLVCVYLSVCYNLFLIIIEISDFLEHEVKGLKKKKTELRATRTPPQEHTLSSGTLEL